MSAIDIHCPKCGAEPGQKCKNYLGKGCAPHRERLKGTDRQGEHWRQAKLKTDRELKKAIDDAPLFAEQTRQEMPTVAANYWRTRFMIAQSYGMGEPHAGFWEDWDVRFLRGLAQRVLPEDVFQALDSKRWTGPLVMYWTKILTSTNRVVLTHKVTEVYGPFPVWRVKGDRDSGLLMVMNGKRLLGDDAYWPPEGWTPPYTPEELDKLMSAPPAYELDDGGLWDRVQAILSAQPKSLCKGESQ